MRRNNIGLPLSAGSPRRTSFVPGHQRDDVSPEPGSGSEDLVAFPASYAQQRLWFLHELSPEASVYNIPVALRLGGPLNVDALERSLAEIVRRHDVLRTAFRLSEGEPIQVIFPEGRVALPRIDLREIPASEREGEVSRLATEEARCPFDFVRGPLWRARLYRLAKQEHVLVVSMHHVVSDGWSVDIFLRELAALYGAFSDGKPSPLRELPIQYADYAAWQRERLDGEVLEEQLGYWKGELRGAPQVLDLPADRPRPPVQTFSGEVESAAFPVDLLNSLKALSQREGVTLFMTLLASFQALLFRYTGQEQVLVGTPIAGRNRVETEGLIGLFVNTLVMRGDVSGDPTFREFLARVREAALRAYDHQDLPFEKLVQELHPERSLSHTPLFQVMFQLFIGSQGAAEFTGLQVEHFPLHRRNAHFELTVMMVAKPGRLGCSVEYNTDLFDRETVRRFLEHFEVLLRSVVEDPDRRISQLPLLTEGERRQVLEEWNRTEREYPRELCLHQLFEAQVERTPESVAVEFEGETLSYGELNRRANQLAHHLRAFGVGPEVLVGICVERSLEMVVGLLGILKAGAAYVPLDPSYPKERIAFMLEDTQSPVLLTQGRLREALPAHSARTLLLDSDREKIAVENDQNPQIHATPQNLAYVIYTSGSTGKPKGVAIEHRGAVNLLHWARETFPTESAAGVVASTSLCFDLSVFEIFTPLSWGGRVILVRDVLSLPSIPEGNDIMLLNTVPSAMSELVRARALPRSVRTVNLAGEPLSPALAEAIFRVETVQRLFNLYGPTESTTYSTASLVERLSQRPPNIGRPIANTRVYILDSHGQPVPGGVVGELYITGEGLARGYWGRPELTLERFVPDSFSGGLGGRLYRTGDLGRYLADGDIEFLGRVDNQVKVRGYRIELEEIESVLMEHPGVREGVVVAREDSPGEKWLVGYMTGEEGLSGDALRGFLRGKLPEYMVPSVFVVLESLPLTPAGKVDRKTLPAPPSTRPDLERRYVAPRTVEEEVVALIWARVLGVERVGVEDNFFESGGHSLLAVQLFAEIENVFHRKIPLAAIFQAPNVEQLAGILRQEGWTAPRSPLVAIQTQGSKPPFFCVHPGGVHAFYYRDLARLLGPDQPFYGLQAIGLAGREAQRDRLENLAADYIKEIRTVQPKGPYYLGGLCAGGIIAFEIARQLHAQGQSVALLALLDTYAPGHPKSLPNERSLAYKVYRFFRRVHLEAGNVLLLEPQKKLPYVLEKARRVKGRARRRIAKMVKELETAIRHPLPPELRQVQAYNRSLLRGYVPQVYPGGATVFRASNRLVGYESDPQLGWGEFVAGGIETYEVPGHHESIAVEPRVRVLAVQLKECLERSRPDKKESSAPVAVFHRPSADPEG